MGTDWETVIGLEIHVQLDTRTKLFCGCVTEPGAPNTRTCPVCLGLPGALPVPNAAAVKLGAVAALGLGCTVHERSEFARKNYFYPDLPKGYQISQFDRPLATGGFLEVAGQRIGIHRLHLEDDAGKSVHDRYPESTAVDCNRAGTPLAEIVTEPDLRSPAQARAFLVELRRLLRYLEVSPCNMEDGQLRVDGNLSVRPRGASELGTKQEVKNLNSFASVQKSLEQMEAAQIATLVRDEPVTQATFSGATDILVPMRSKEDSDDYRYFPDPDLPILGFTGEMIEQLQSELPELPQVRRRRLVEKLGISDSQADVISDEKERADYFEKVVAHDIDPREAANWVTGTVLKDVNLAGTYRVGPDRLARLISMVTDGAVSGQAAKKTFAVMAVRGGDPETVAEELGLVQQGNADVVAEWLESAIQARPDEWARYLDGEDKLQGFFMGEVMKVSKGSAKPDAIRAAIQNRRTR